MREETLFAAKAGNWLDRKGTFLVVGCMFLVLNTLFKNLLEVNEQDVLAVAKHLVDPGWIPGDWYLGLDNGYRNLFNFLAGGLARLLPLTAVSLIGRLTVIALFSVVYTRYTRALGIPLLLLVPALFLVTDQQSIVAGEWMTESLETKTFSYVFLLAALVLLHERKFPAAAASLGLSVSFHVLVGGYGAMAMLLPLSLVFAQDRPPLKILLASFLLFLITASPGIVALISNLISNSGNARESLVAGLIYSRSRVPHHVLPGYWPTRDLFWFRMLRLAASLAMIGYALFRPRNPFQRMVALFASASLLFALAGLIMYFAGRDDLLKYYPFRLPDAILPFSAVFIFFSYVKPLAERYLPAGRKLVCGVVAAALSLAILLAVLPAFLVGVGKLISDQEYYVYQAPRSAAKRQLFSWIQDNTPEDAVFIIPPGESRFYLAAERAQFVSRKHSPQAEEDILEWYRRLQRLNGGAPFEDYTVDWSAIRGEYDVLSAAVLEAIREEYGVTHYVGPAGRDIPFNEIHRQGSMAVYDLSGERSRSPSGGD